MFFSLSLHDDPCSVLHPLGFTYKSHEWYGSAHQVFTDINREYRHEAKVDILEGARKIRRLKGRGSLVGRIVSLLRMAAQAEVQLTEVRFCAHRCSEYSVSLSRGTEKAFVVARTVLR